jgi:antitoxin ParD1/3/4
MKSQMNISLHPKHEEFVNQQIQLGRYTTAEELVYVAIGLLQQREDLDIVRQEIQAGAAQIAARRVIDGDRALDRVQMILSKSQMLLDM